MSYKMARSEVRRMAAYEPVGDPFGGPAFGQKRDILGEIGDATNFGGWGDKVNKIVDPVGNAVNLPTLDPIAQGYLDPMGRNTDKTLDLMDQYGLKGVGELTNKYGPYVAAMIFSMGASGAAGVGAEGAAADGVAAGTSDIGIGAGGAGQAGSTSLAEGAAGVSTSGAETLAQPTTTGAVGSNAAPAAIQSSSAGASMPPAAQSMPAAVMDAPAVAAMNPPAAPSPGLISSAMDWAKANQGLTAGALMVGGGALQGAANRSSAKELQERKIAAEREAALAKLQNQRDFVQSGSYFGANVPIRPGANSVLRRPDGTPVYSSPGLVAAAMK